MSSSSPWGKVTDPDWERLDAAWDPARAAGVLGTVSVENLRAHAAGFVPAACGVLDEAVCVDVGTGAGVPGLVLAMQYPTSRWLLVDASERRCNLVRRVVHELGLSDRVTVRHERGEDVAHDPSVRGTADLAVARLLGPPAETVELLLPLLDPTGVAVVSIDVSDPDWSAAATRPEFSTARRREATGDFVELRPTAPVPDPWPRRANVRRRSPIFSA